MADDNTKVAELEGAVTDLEAQLTELGKKLAKALEGDAQAETLKALTDQVSELSKSVKVLKDERDALAKEKADDEALEKAMSDMTDEEMAHCKGMSREERSRFAAMSKADRKKAMKVKKEADDKAAAADPTITIEGQSIRKSVVGEDMFEVLKAQAERNRELSEAVAVEKSAREHAILLKRADDEFAHVPGTAEERAHMLGAIGKMDEALAKSFMAVFTQSEKLAKAGFGKIGVGGSDPKDTSVTKARSDFDARVDVIKARDKCSYTEAVKKARAENPELFKALRTTEAEAEAN